LGFPLLTLKFARLWALVALPLLAATAGVALLAPPPTPGYDCLIVPGTPTQPEWMLDISHGVDAWNRQTMDAPFRYVQTSSPNGRYQIVRSQRVSGNNYESLGWFLEDAWNGTQTRLEHSAGFDAWSAGSRVVAYVSEPMEQPRQLTIYEPETGTSRTSTLSADEYVEALSADGQYLLLQNALDFERRIVATADFSEVVHTGQSGQWQSTPWPPQGNRIVLMDNGVPTLFRLDDDSSIPLEGLPDNAATRNTIWSPDGARFAIVSILSDSSYGLNIFDISGQPLIEPILSPVVAVPLPQFGRWSNNGTRFGFIQDEALMVVDVTSGDIETLVGGAERMGMTWSYSPSSAAYLPMVNLQDDGLALTMVDLSTMQVAGQLVENAARIDLPFWTWDASRVAVKWDTVNGETRLSWANSSDFIAHDVPEPGRFYSEDTPLDNTARWLDAGTLLMYSAYRDDESGIYIANVETGDIERITGDLDWTNPHITLAASALGDRMVMSYRPQGLNGPSVFVLFTTDGRFERVLPTDSYVMPAWSPDGQRIAHWDTLNSAILVYDIDGEIIFRTTEAPPNGGFQWATCAVEGVS
jgi:Tol biopolymer transport system component